MQINRFNILSALLFLQACSYTNNDVNRLTDTYHDKSYFNQEWQKQGVSQEEWYYRITVIEAPINTRALSVGEGHWLHPDVLRWEITKDLLVGWRPHSLVLGADNENSGGVKEHYRGAPVVAFAITSHFDIEKQQDPDTEGETNIIDESYKKPWYERRFIRVDWTRNIVSRLKRGDENEGIGSSNINTSTTHMVETNFAGNPKRARFSKSHMEFVTRHPLEVSQAAVYGYLGDPFVGDNAAVVVDVRHAFLKKAPSDFVSLPYPDHVVEVDGRGDPVVGPDKKQKTVPINDRIGMFRTNLVGQKIYDRQTGTSEKTIMNATLFNIWEKSHDEYGAIIPMEQRQAKPIVYYMNVLHPSDLMSESYQVAKEWDMAFRSAVFYAQPGRYKSIDAVPQMWILRKNDCDVSNVDDWLAKKVPGLREDIERGARVDFESIKDELDALSRKGDNWDFNEKTYREIEAKRKLEQICSSLEFYTENLEDPFVYQRAGDMRFSMMNLEVGNNITSWSGYGPMISDGITGEIISATANVNLKYINEKAQKISKQMGLLNLKNPGLQAVFGSGVNGISNTAAEAARSIATKAYSKSNIDMTSFMQRTENFFESNDLGISQSELATLAQIKADLNSKIGASGSFLDSVSHGQKVGIEQVVAALPSTHKNVKPFDSIGFIDDISISVAYKFAKLPDEERFLKIRNAIYKAVMLHEIGHNMGLEHNMAASADALNYGEQFWWIQSLPKNLEAAATMVNHPDTEAKLRECIEENMQYAAKMGGRELSTQDCLQQKTGMYASIMDYHASALADIQGLGLYDKAAIKWAYAQIAEIFPKENLVVDSNKIELSKWIKLNDYRLISQALLKNAQTINQRHHVKFTWGTSSTAQSPPTTMVPYMFCNDPSGLTSPRCAAFDFGADMESSALWLKSRFWNQYLLTHFANDGLVNSKQAMLESIKIDIDILERFTKILRWYYKNLREDKDFAGSYAEKDYLKAVAIGMNHFAHVLGLPDSGGYVSAPNWSLEGKNSWLDRASRLEPARIFVPFNELSMCEAKSLTNVDKKGEVHGRGGYKFIEVPLGIGRPFNHGYSDEVEEPRNLYFGTNIVKKYAILLLSSPIVSPSTVIHAEQKEFGNISWHSLFPEAVSKLLGAVISEKYEDIGPVINEKNEIIARDVIDEDTLAEINYSGAQSIMPTSDPSLPILAMASAAAFLSDNSLESANFIKSMRIVCHGCNNESSDGELDGKQVSFTHLSGHEYSASKDGEAESIAANLLTQANKQKKIYLNIIECIENEEKRTQDPFCQCVKTVDRRSFDEWKCCSEDNPTCSQPEFEAVGQGACSLRDLEIRKNKSLDRLDVMVGFIDEVRRITRKAMSL